ncbi:MAG: LytTR family DNA-binding domain-containing protein [Bacteroidales bacterium]|nr:LytTR family DNA-binding domain-containing protein [Bacteroidales bacterium]
MTLSCIIVEDEPVSQDLLEQYIKDTPNLKLLATCNNAFEARDVLLEQKPDLMFLDINMPKLSGMSFFKSLTKPPMVIFTTAYPEYAIESYEVNAVDYLMKPFSFHRFLMAVDKAFERTKKTNGIKNEESYVMLKADKKVYKVPVKQITHLEAMGDYVKVHYDNTYILVHDTLQHLLEEIQSGDLVRVHRSWVVSITHIKYIEGNQVTINKQEIPVGKSYREEFLKKFNAEE